MGLDIEYSNGQTPLDDDEKEDLLIPTITTRFELDDFEQQNIEEAMLWIAKRKFSHQTILTDAMIRGIHKRMFGHIWRWAGQFRRTNKNIGVDKWQIALQLKQLLEDVAFWIENQCFPPEELALRFKHRLVCIHCFPNGNGRHSRLMADILIEKVFNKPTFSWGANNLTSDGEARHAYLTALHAADNGDFGLLIQFARS